jgi:hypothetical protein
MTNITLDDQAMQGFIRDGYVVVQPELDADFHRHVFDSIDHVFETEGNPGNNLMARISAIGKVWADPAVDGALQSILGHGYYMHPHRHCHFRPPHSEGQTLHKDGFSRRRHRTRWTLAMYYPQETTLEMGPTAFVPGSHYFNTAEAGTARDEMALSVPAGSVAIVDYDIWHRGTANVSDRKRYMVKFLFLRMEEPSAPSWDGAGAEWRSEGGHDAMWSSMWDWHTGGNGHDDGAASNGNSVDDLLHTVVNAEEKACLDATYELAGMGGPAVAPLMNALQADYGDAAPPDEVSYGRLAAADRPEQIRRNISYGLASIGAPAVPALIEAAGHPDWWVRDAAVETLGDIGPAAAASVPVLTEALGDESLQVRRHASEALGIAGQNGNEAVPGVVDSLGDPDEVTRRNAVLALARIGPAASGSVPALKGVLGDEDRYVRGKAVEALRRIGTPEAHDVLIEDLLTSRWCEITTKDTLY